jgi:hypothetical protein
VTEGKVLVVQLARLGDMVQTWPLLRRLRHQDPGLHLDLLSDHRSRLCTPWDRTWITSGRLTWPACRRYRRVILPGPMTGCGIWRRVWRSGTTTWCTISTFPAFLFCLRTWREEKSGDTGR